LEGREKKKAKWIRIGSDSPGGGKPANARTRLTHKKETRKETSCGEKPGLPGRFKRLATKTDVRKREPNGPAAPKLWGGKTKEGKGRGLRESSAEEGGAGKRVGGRTRKLVVAIQRLEKR